MGKRVQISSELRKDINSRIRGAVSHFSFGLESEVKKALTNATSHAMGITRHYNDKYEFERDSVVGNAVKEVIKRKTREHLADLDKIFDDLIKDKFLAAVESAIDDCVNSHDYRKDLRGKLQDKITYLMTERITQHLNDKELLPSLMGIVSKGCGKLLVDITNPDDTNDAFGQLVLDSIASALADDPTGEVK